MHGFTALHRNFMTYIVILIIIGVQVLSCFTWIGRPILETAKVEGRGWFITIILASSVFIVNALLKLIPMEWASKYLDRLDVEENAIGKDSALLTAYNKQSKQKAYAQPEA